MTILTVQNKFFVHKLPVRCWQFLYGIRSFINF